MRKHSANRIRLATLAMSALMAFTLAMASVLAVPKAVASGSYDIGRVGSVTLSDLIDIDNNGQSVAANGHRYVNKGADDWNAWKHLHAIALLDTHIDDMGALREGDTVTIPLTQSGRFGWSTPSVDSTVRNGVGDVVFTVRADGTAVTLTRTQAPAVGSMDFQLQPVIDNWSGYKASVGFTTTLTAGGSSFTFTSIERADDQGAASNNNNRYAYITGEYTDHSTITARLQSDASHNLVARGKTLSWLKTPWVFHFHVASADGHGLILRGFSLSGWSYAAYDATTAGQTYSVKINGGIDTTAVEGDLSVRGGWKRQTNEDGSLDLWFNAGATYGDDAVRYNDGAYSDDEATNQYLKNSGYLAGVVDGNFDIGFDSATETRSATVTCDVTSDGATYAMTSGSSFTIRNVPVASSVADGMSAIEYVGNGATGGAYASSTDKPGTATGVLTNADGPNFTRDGYTFTGWNTAMDGSGDPYEEGGAIEYPAEGRTLTLYAQWKRTAHTVSFDTNGGDSGVDAQTVTDGQTASMVTPLRAGYTFDGWYLDGEAYDFETPVTGDITLKAAWRKTGTASVDAGASKTVARHGDVYTLTLTVTGSRSGTSMMRGVTVSDPLSDWVDPVGLKDGKADGITVTRDGETMDGGYDASYDVETRTVTVRFADALDDGITYAVAFDVGLNAKATLDYMTNGGYPDTGDKDTGDVSAGARGYRSNGTAIVSWDAVTVSDGVPETVPSACSYPQPVVRFTDGLPSVLVSALPGTGARKAIVPVVAGVGVMVAVACAWFIRRRLSGHV